MKSRKSISKKEINLISQEHIQVKSPKRVLDHGEVFTSPREVNAMLDLVKDETENIESRFLEPACGDGNFLVEILRRKLDVVLRRHSKNQIIFERYAFIAVGSLYGIDLLQDNVEHCRVRLFNIAHQIYKDLFDDKINNDFFNSLKFVLHRNIIWGNALTLENAGLVNDPITFSEWSVVHKNMVQRRDFKMQSLLENQKMDGPNLFSDLGEDAFIPVPIKTYPLQNFYNLGEDVQYKL